MVARVLERRKARRSRRSLAERLRRRSIRDKLLALVLLPLLVVLPLLGALLLGWGSVAFDRLLITKVRSDLAVAHGYFDRVLGEVAASAGAVADSQALHRLLGDAAAPAPGAQALVALLKRFREREAVDFLVLRAVDGGLLASDAGPGDGLGLMVPTVPTTRDGRARASVEVLPVEALARLAPRLEPRVSVPLVPTRNAAPTQRTVEDRAMAVLAASPVRGADGRVVAEVLAGVLLNRNLPFIDHINEIVYPEGALPFGSQGTATLFLDDVRISTNVRLFGGATAAERARAGDRGEARAIGTRVSQSVREAVLGRGSTWLDSAFVVNDWYVSAYEPLANGAGERVGMLYVGFLERPFTWLKYGVLAVTGAIFFAVMIGAALVSLRLARSIFRPLERMERTMQQVEAGDGSARVGTLRNADEIGRLAGHLDHLLDVVDDKTRTLQRWNAELDLKVAERTRELQAAQQQLVRSEKMAAVGQLTASIAHEVNNPIAVIQGNLDLVRELLGDEAARVRPELRLVDEQIERMRLIVTQLLQFARPTEFAGYVEAVDVGRMFEDCLVLTGHLLAKTRIVVARDVATQRQPAINRNELQQVIVNLMVNAIHAMPEGGRLELQARDGAGGTVDIVVADSGPGLSDELIKELFQPFVTRKKDGTGLGLWISRSIVERYGGDIRAGGRTDGTAGAVFTVSLQA